MTKDLEKFTIHKGASYLEALNRINMTTKGFVVVLDDDEKVVGTLTDGDIRRALIECNSLSGKIDHIYKQNFTCLELKNSLADAIPIFKNEAINFIPIINDNGCLENIITKKQLHALLLKDIKADLHYDFMSLDETIVEHEIFERPWGFYKTTVMNDYFQSKIICVHPQASLSLQKHHRREEHWIVAHGEGLVQLGESMIPVCAGSSLFIPKDCKHRLTNTSQSETLIVTEVQIGDYFGEDDIIRYEDMYGRECI